MIVGRGKYQQTSAARGALAALSHGLSGIWVVGTLLLAGCGDIQVAQQQVAEQEPVPTAAAPNDKVAETIRRVLAARAQRAAQPPKPHRIEVAEVEALPEPVAEVIAAGEAEPELQLPSTSAAVAAWKEESPANEPPQAAPNLGILLPPQMAAECEYPVTTSEPYLAAPAMSEVPAQVAGDPRPKTPEIDGLSDAERRLVEQVIRESPEAATGVLTDARVNEMATASIREANALANRGAQFAAKQKLIEVMRMISQAKDAHEGGRLHSAALAAGLRALEEAEDFSPRGTQLEAEMEVTLVAAAHRTPITRRLQSSEVLPRQMMDLYFRYAQVKLAISVAGEPSGSMALYALGKVTSQIGQSASDRDRISHRQAVAFQQAALLAHNQNYFAAHELAVLMTESGRLAEAEHLLKQVAARQPNPTVYRNLAHVQERMGRTQLAANSRAMATQMAAKRPAGSGQIRWVGPEAFGTSPVTPAQYAGPTPAAPRPANAGQRTALAPPSRAPQQSGPIPPGSWR